MTEKKYNSEYDVNYALLVQQAESLIGGVPHQIANLANLSALLYQNLPDLNWAGFYLMKEGRLVLGPFQGKTACIEISLGRGVCGTAAERDETVIVKNVHDFPGHIACDSASLSEIVIPVHKGDRVVGVLDIDSPVEARFGDADREGLEKIVRVLERELEKVEG